MVLASQDITELKHHVSEIAAFLRQHEWLWRSHVVDFFKKKLWEKVDEEWNSCLRVASAESWLLLPSGVVKEEWPDSLKEFVGTACRVSLSRGQVDSSSDSYPGVPQVPIGSVLRQGMSVKKLHEIGILAALIAGTAKLSGAKDVIDVGAGQGYLALVLAFEYRLSVTAVDACAHHADVTNKRAVRIEKYYNTRLRKSQQDGSNHPEVRAPQTVTCRIGTEESSSTLSSLLPALPKSLSSEVFFKDSNSDHDEDPQVVLAGLHACGDLSATMLRTFIECEDVVAVINVTCCYHLLTEESNNDTKELSGFPMSETVANLGLQIGRSARELACESAERWKEHHPTKAVQNFELHAFRAAFQLILDRHYPEFANSRPSVGRVGKSRRRRKARQSAMEPLIDDTSKEPLLRTKDDSLDVGCVTCIGASLTDASEGPLGTSTSSSACTFDILTGPSQDRDILRVEQENIASSLLSDTESLLEQQLVRFEEYVRPVLELFDLPQLPTSILKSIWTEVAPYQDLVGPFYSLRTVLAPVIESYILLDRLLYLKEQGELVAAKCGTGAGIAAHLVPIFEPATSPRNMAIIAYRGGV
ncbi:hypothetical protein M758_6G132500 [Ceratodon purpureus]|nr:hypothetical protein M758_6G132500 [Ceratodon purpureus]